MKKGKFNSQLEAAKVIATNHGLRASALIDWVTKYNIDLIKYGHLISSPKVCKFDLINDVISERFVSTKKYFTA